MQDACGPMIVVMGVAGSGKSTVGDALAARLGVPFVDADDAHTEAAKEQMARGEPLTEEQRAPWLDRLHGILAEHVGSGVVLACSALTIAARRRLAGELSVRFVVLLVSEDELAERLRARRDHFAGSDLLASQLATLELDPSVIAVDGSLPVEEIVDSITTTVVS